MVERISATEAARGFSEVLNRVKYQGTSFEVERGSEVIARIVPVRAPSRVKMSELTRLFARLPQLGEAEAEAFEQDLEAVRHALPPVEDPWE